MLLYYIIQIIKSSFMDELCLSQIKFYSKLAKCSGPNNPHPLYCLYDSLSSPPVAGVWWAHTLDWLYDSLSSPPVTGVWWAHTLDWLYDSLSSPPVAGVWCALAPLSCGSDCIIQVDAGGWGETPLPPHMFVKRFGIQQYTIKRYINASFVRSYVRSCDWM